METQKTNVSAPGAKPGSTCAVCAQPVNPADLVYANDQPVCTNCKNKLTAELASQRADGQAIALGLLGGCVAAIIGAIAWGLLVIVTNYEVGYVAIGVGALAGFGVYLAAGKKRGIQLQIVASAASILGILLGKYIAFYHSIQTYIRQHPDDFGEEALAKLSLFSFDLFSLFIRMFSEWFSPYDVLWVILAVYTAYRIPRVLKVTITGPKT